MAGPPAQDGIGQLAQIAQLEQPERTAQLQGGQVALGPAGGVARVAQLAAGPAVHDDEGRLFGQGDRFGLEGGEVDVHGMAGLRGTDGQRIEEADVGPGQGFGLLAAPGHLQRVDGVVGTQSEEQGDRESGARGQPGTEGDGAGHRQGAA